MKNPILQLKEQITKLTDSQRRVADYIIKNPVDVAFLTVDQLAGLVGTSTTTIMRLTYNIGYSGYSEFQKGLQELLRTTADPNTRLEVNLKNKEGVDLWIQSAENQINNINSTMSMISKESLEKVLELILQAQNIHCTAIRSAIPVAQSLSYGLSRLIGKGTLINADLGEWTEKVIDFTSDDLVIAISFPRYGNKVIEFIRAAKAQNAKIIAITDSYSSPLVNYSDIVLNCNVSSLAFHNSILAPMFLVDYLITAVASNDIDLTKARFEKIDSLLTGMKYHHLETFPAKR